jgi:hypothetical protein
MREEWTEEGFKARRRALRDEYCQAAAAVEALAGQMANAPRPYARDLVKLQTAMAKLGATYGRWLEVHRMVDPQ